MRIDLNSSLLFWMEYFAEEHRLQLAFHSGEVYDYFDVPPAIPSELLAASSKGRYFNLNIRDRFPTLRLHDFLRNLNNACCPTVGNRSRMLRLK